MSSQNVQFRRFKRGCGQKFGPERVLKVGKRYTVEEKIRAVKLYEKLGHITWVITELGYPSSRTLLYEWIKKYRQGGLERLTPKPKYSEEQRKAAIQYYLSNGMNVTATINALGYPGKTLMREWLNDDLPKGMRKWHCKANDNVVRYTHEQKEKAVTLYCSGEKPKDISQRLSVRPEAIRVWAKQMLGKEVPYVKKTSSHKNTISNNNTDDLLNAINELETKRNELEKEVYHLQMQKDILEKAGEILKKDKGIRLSEISNKEKAELIDALREKYRLKELLEELHIGKSSYCYQQSIKIKPDKYYETRQQIKSIFDENYQCYGYRRIYGALKRIGKTISEKVIRRIMTEDGLMVRITQQRKYNSYKGELTPEVPNIIERDFHADLPNQKWLTDITEFHIPAGKVYLSPMIDCFDGGVVAWSLGTSPDAELTNGMLDNAISTLSAGEHPIVHSDRGCHYRWPQWIQKMDEAKLIRSMSKKACSPDNSACEGFFGRLKNEVFYGRSWVGVSIEEFVEIIDTYIHWYNEKRIKQSLGFLSPYEYRKIQGYI